MLCVEHYLHIRALYVSSLAADKAPIWKNEFVYLGKGRGRFINLHLLFDLKPDTYIRFIFVCRFKVKMK